MIRAVLFDIGGTLHTVHRDADSADRFSALLLRRLAAAGICLETTPQALSGLLARNAEAYKHLSEETRKELPSPVIWGDYYLKDFPFDREKLAPVAEELSCLYDSVRVQNIPRPHMKETLESLYDGGLVLGIISNIISRRFVPDLLERYGVGRLMSCVVLSSETGVRKPDRKIFEIASARIRIPLAEMAYVGDTLSRDVLGCRNAGTGLCIQIDNPSIAHRDAALTGTGLKPDILIRDLAEIPALIREENRRHLLQKRIH